MIPMNEKKKAKIINKCLDAVMLGAKSKQECLDRYPELKTDLLDAFSISCSIRNFQAPRLTLQQKSQMKNQLLFKLADRSDLVTKSSQIHYRWQKTKRRFAMTWVIIVTTFLSLISGAGVVYASNSALPGEMLYPVKTWVEDTQLTLSPDTIDIMLLEKFSDKRIGELVALAEKGQWENIGGLVESYQNRNQLMMALIAQIEAQNPDEAVRLRAELNNRLQEHARIIEGFLQIDGKNDPVQDRLRVMLQTNEQTRLRINRETAVVEPVETLESTPDLLKTPAVLPGPETKFQNQNQNRVVDLPDEFLQNGALKFQFRFDRILEGGVYVEVAGTRYDCLVEGALVTCDVTGVPGVGKLNLFQHDSNLLLYSYNYDHNYSYLWEGTKESGSSQTQKQGNPESGNGSPENSQNGMK